MSDRASVYEYTSDGEVIDPIRGGQGVLGITIGRVWREVGGTLDELPMERTEKASAVIVKNKLAGHRTTKRRKA